MSFLFTQSQNIHNTCTVFLCASLGAYIQYVHFCTFWPLTFQLKSAWYWAFTLKNFLFHLVLAPCVFSILEYNAFVALKTWLWSYWYKISSTFNPNDVCSAWKVPRELSPYFALFPLFLIFSPALFMPLQFGCLFLSSLSLLLCLTISRPPSL